MPHKPGIGAILGVVSEDGVAKEDFPVTLLDRTTGKLVARHTTDENGGFVFNGLNPETNDYMVIAQDEDETDTDTYKDAIVKDRIQPIYASQGSTYYGNWRKLAADNGAVCICAPMRSPESAATTTWMTATGSQIQGVVSNSASSTLMTPVFGESICPGAPDIATLKVSAGAVHVPPILLPVNSVLAALSDPPPYYTEAGEATFEAVLDLSSMSVESSSSATIYIGAWQIYYGCSGNTDTYNCTPILGFTYSPSASTLQLWKNDGSGGESYFTSNMTSVGDAIDVTDYLDGAHHFTFTVACASSAILYIDGVAVSTTSLSGGTAYFRQYSNALWMYGQIFAFSSLTSNARATTLGGFTGSISAMASYPSALDADTVASLYEALMVGSTPLVTGYAKSVVTDYPSFYARLNETVGATSVDQYLLPSDAMPYAAGDVYGTVTFGKDSSVTGGNAALFGGGGIRFNYANAYAPNPDGFSIDFVGAAPSTTPTANQYIAELSTTGEACRWFRLYENTSGQMVLYVYLMGGTTETVTFTTALDSDMHHYGVSLDKVNKLATLYIDGEAVETQSVGTTLADYEVFTLATYLEMHIGGLVADAGSVTYPCAWTLAEVAVYPYVLAAARFASHYAEMGTV